MKRESGESVRIPYFKSLIKWGRFKVDSKEWVKGYSTEGAGACIQYAFDVLKHQKIYATVEKENFASKKVIEKLGRTYERDVMCFSKKVELYSIKKDNQRAVILLHEIYGMNEHIRSKCDELRADGYDVFCPSLLSEDRVYTYEQEAAAYCNYVEVVGAEAAYKKAVQMYEKVAKKYKTIFIVGYSVGATLAWRLGAAYQVDGIVCFYGSRIRDYVQLTPRSPVLMFFALEEKGFDVIALAERLKLKEAVTWIEIYKAFHGFADPYNKNYHEEYAKDAKDKMKLFMHG